MIQIGETTEDESKKPRFASLSPDQSINTITLDEALDLFKFPKKLGSFESFEIVLAVGKFGPYLKHNNKNISIPKGEPVEDVNLERAIDLIRMKQQADAPIAEYEGLPVQKGKGRFGPFIKWNDMYINIPRAYHFDTLSQQDIDELVAKKMEKEANRFIKQWPAEKISIENGRWGPFIRFNKKMLKLGKAPDGNKYTAETLADIDVEAVKKMIEAQVPNAFSKKTKAAKPKATKTKTAKPKAKKV